MSILCQTHFSLHSIFFPPDKALIDPVLEYFNHVLSGASSTSVFLFDRVQRKAIPINQQHFHSVCLAIPSPLSGETLLLYHFSTGTIFVFFYGAYLNNSSTCNAIPLIPDLVGGPGSQNSEGRHMLAIHWKLVITIRHVTISYKKPNGPQTAFWVSTP